MASNRDPRKSYRTNRRGRRITSSSDRSARSKKSTVPRPTSSSTRATTKGSSSRVTTGQGGNRTRVKVKPQSTGLIGTRNTPATKTTYTGPKTPGVSFNPSKRVKIKPRAGIGAAAAQTAGMYLAGKMAETIGKKGQSKMSKFGITSKSKPAASKPKMKPAPGMSKGAVAAAKKGAAEANKAKSPVKSSVSPKKTSKGVSTPKAKSKASVAASKPRSAAPKPKATSGKNPYRVPKGAERKDRMSKVIAELKATRERSRKRQGK